MSETQDVLTPAEAAPLLRCHVKTVLRMIHEGKLKASRYGSRNYRIHKSSIEACLAGTEVVTKVVTEDPLSMAPNNSQPLRLSPSKGNKRKGDYRKPDWWKGLANA